MSAYIDYDSIDPSELEPLLLDTFRDFADTLSDYYDPALADEIWEWTDHRLTMSEDMSVEAEDYVREYCEMRDLDPYEEKNALSFWRDFADARFL